MIRVVIPPHLQTLAGVRSEVNLTVDGIPTVASVLDALENHYPMLKGTVRDHVTQKRRPFLRFFACGKDISHEPPETALPDPVILGEEPFIILGAISGG